MTTVKDLPILFKGDMVRAILKGRKTQTRRTVISPGSSVRPCDFDSEECLIELENTWNGFRVWRPSPCGQPGDRLWVRETWRIGMWDEKHRLFYVEYKSAPEHSRWFSIPDDSDGLKFNTIIERIHKDMHKKGLRTIEDSQGMGTISSQPLSWWPSIHMPRWASRILLEVVSVRVDRLRNINEDDAKREGAVIGQFYPGAAFEPMNYRDAFSQLWDSLASPGVTWADNPWVWAVEFKRVEVQS